MSMRMTCGGLTALLLAACGPGVPGGPTEVTATAGVDQVTVQWSAPLDPGKSPIEAFVVRALSDQVVATVEASAPDTQAEVTGLQRGTTYTFTVSARNKAGEGPLSPASAPITLPDVPGLAMSLSGVPGDHHLLVSWQAPPDNGSSVTGYHVTLSPTDTALSLSADVRQADFAQLTNGVSYVVTVTALNAVGTGPVASITAIPATLPEAPSGVSAAAGVRQATVSWIAPTDDGGRPVAEYVVTPYTQGIPQTPTVVLAPATQTTVGGLANDTLYSFTVTARNAMGLGAAASSGTVHTPALPAVPSSAIATRGNAQAQVSWSAPADDGGSSITGYRVTPHAGAGAGTPVSAAGLSTSVTGLTNGTAYTFTVSAVTAVGIGAAATTGSVTPATVPGAPTSVVAHAGDSQATVQWGAPANGGDAITGYTVTVSPGGTQLTTAGTSLSFLGLVNGTSYTFTAVAQNSVGTGLAGGPSTAVIPGPPPSDCKTAHLQDPNTPSGVLTLALPGGSAPVYCDMSTDGGGWTLVYKLSAGVASDAAALWEDVVPLNELDTSLLNVRPSSSAYVSRLVTSYWNTGGVTWTEARVGVYSGGAEKAFVQLDVSGSTRTDWFALAHVTSATWSDLASSGQNFFGVEGDWAVKRNWFINHSYGSGSDACSTDDGWLVVSTGGSACGWEIQGGAPVRIRYAPSAGYANWTNVSLAAEVFAVFAR